LYYLDHLAQMLHIRVDNPKTGLVIVRRTIYRTEFRRI